MKSRAAAWTTAIVVALAAAAVHAATHRGEVFGPLADESLLIPIALRRVDPSLYPGDRWLATTADVFSVPYSWLVGLWLRVIDDPVVAMRLLSIPAHVVLLAGTWRLVERFAGRVPAVVATLLVALPPCSILVFAPGGALPRDLVFAALPWMTLALLDAPSPRRAVVLFAALGLLANLHPLTGLHFAALLLFVGLVVDPTKRGFGACVVRGLAFVAGASPYVVQYLRLPRPGGSAGQYEAEVYAWRLPEMAGETWGPLAARVEPSLWMTAGAGVALLVARKNGFTPPRTLVVAWLVAFVLGVFGPSLGYVVDPLRAVQLGRLERIADWHAAVVFATCVVATCRARAFAASAAATACFAASTIQAGAFDESPGPKGPIARLGRRFDRQAGVPIAPPAPSWFTPRKNVVDPTSPVERDDFLAVCRFAREQTPKDALFLVPPEHWAPFRVYARRGVSVTRKEGGAALSFLGGAGPVGSWFYGFQWASNVYAGGDLEYWTWHAGAFSASYLVVDPATGSPPPWPEVFSAGKFRVLDARRK